MRRTSQVLAIALVAVAHVAAAAAPAKKLAPTPELAKSLVDGVRVEAEDVVLLRTNADSLPLAELVAAEVSRRGGSVVLSYEPASVVRTILAETPEGYLERPSPYAAAQLQLVNAIIELGPSDDPALELGVDPMRLVRADRGRQALLDKFYGTSLRRLVLGGTAYPTDDAGKLFKADPAALSKGFQDALAVKAPILEDRVNRLRKALSGLRVVRVTTPNGTDLELRLAARPIYANLGRIDEDVLKRDGVKEAALPAGDVATVPTEFFATGPLVVDAVECHGVLVRDLKFSFKEGKATLEGGGENFEVFKKAFNLASGDKGVIGSFSIGTNEASKPTGLYRSPEMSGVVTIGIGSNRGEGGFNASTFQARFRLANATVKIDGQPLVEAGVLKLK